MSTTRNEPGNRQQTTGILRGVKFHVGIDFHLICRCAPPPHLPLHPFRPSCCPPSVLPLLLAPFMQYFTTFHLINQTNCGELHSDWCHKSNCLSSDSVSGLETRNSLFSEYFRQVSAIYSYKRHMRPLTF